MSKILTDRHDDKADRIALSAIHVSMRKLRAASDEARKQGRCDAANDADRVADSIGALAAEIRLRIEGSEVW